jgi:SAM-dependent methyltransferase
VCLSKLWSITIFKITPDTHAWLVLGSEVLFWVLAICLCIEAYFLVFHGGIPNVRTAKPIRAEIIRRLQADYAARGVDDYTILDLGSGNGHFTREIAKAMPQAKVIGLELAAPSVRWCNHKAQKMGLKNLSYVQTDFLAYNFSTAQAIVMFVIPSGMDKIAAKLTAEARPGTFISSNKFPLCSGWVPTEELKVKTRWLNQGKLYLYRKA